MMQIAIHKPDLRVTKLLFPGKVRRFADSDEVFFEVTSASLHLQELSRRGCLCFVNRAQVRKFYLGPLYVQYNFCDFLSDLFVADENILRS